MGSFGSFDGARIVYDVEGDGPVVLLLHGYVADSYINWVRPGLVSRLTAAGYRTVAVDHRGHGMSDKPHEPEAYADLAMGKDVAALLDHLALDRVAVVGYSMGAMVTLRLLAAGEERIRAVVAGGVGGATFRMREGATAIADAMEAADKATISNAFARSFRDFADLTKGDRRALAAVQRQPPAEPPDLAAIDVPVLVLTGDNDPLIGDPSALAHEIPEARWAVVGGSHLNVVNNPAFHDEVVAFLDEHRGSF